jgi:hypothetical protein
MVMASLGFVCNGSSQVYHVYHGEIDPGTLLGSVDELTMRCIVEALKQDPRAGMEESDG